MQTGRELLLLCSICSGKLDPCLKDQGFHFLCDPYFPGWGDYLAREKERASAFIGRVVGVNVVGEWSHVAQHERECVA